MGFVKGSRWFYEGTLATKKTGHLLAGRQG